jgi:hypothetical protein
MECSGSGVSQDRSNAVGTSHPTIPTRKKKTDDMSLVIDIVSFQIGSLSNR